MTFGNWYRSKYPFIASEEEYARLNDAWEVAFEAGQSKATDKSLINVKNTASMTARAKMPRGTVVTNVYDAYAAGQANPPDGFKLVPIDDNNKQEQIVPMLTTYDL